jgi:pilus assembly protein Flp/PilA
MKSWLRVRLILTALGAQDGGATATEYAILVSFIAVVIVGGVTVFGQNMNDWFSTLAGQLP